MWLHIRRRILFTVRLGDTVDIILYSYTSVCLCVYINNTRYIYIYSINVVPTVCYKGNMTQTANGPGKLNFGVFAERNFSSVMTRYILQWRETLKWTRVTWTTSSDSFFSASFFFFLFFARPLVYALLKDDLLLFHFRFIHTHIVYLTYTRLFTSLWYNMNRIQFFFFFFVQSKTIEYDGHIVLVSPAILSVSSDPCINNAHKTFGHRVKI